MADKAWYVYIMTNKSGTLYIGMTNNLARRVWQHREKLAPGFTSRYNICRLLYAEAFKAPQEAIACEKQMKGCSRAKKLALIRKANPEFKELALEEPT